MRPMNAPVSVRQQEQLRPDQATDQADQLNLALGNNGSRRLTLANKATAQAQTRHHQCQRKCNFFHLSPLSELAGVIKDHRWHRSIPAGRALV
jgi:hypothetical protein